MSLRLRDTSPIVEASNVSVAYDGSRVLDINSFKVFPNEVLAILGPNGSGKTTLLLCLSMLLKPMTGTISFNGVEVSGSTGILNLRRQFAVVFQESLLLNGTVWDNVTLGLRLRKVKKNEIEVRARNWMERFGILPLANRQARTLSSGEAKRTSLARAFILQPDILFLDEPFNALDGPTHQSLVEDFESVLRETGITTVMVTHDRNEALVLADRVAVIMNGSIRQLGTPENVFSSPVDEEVAGFVEAGNLFSGLVVESQNGLASIEVNGVRLEAVSDLVAGSKVTAYLHYDDVVIGLPSSELPATSARNRIRGRVARILPLGTQFKVTVNCGFNIISIITKQSLRDLGLEINSEVVATFKASALHLIAHGGKHQVP